jgi:hypothetical protein
MTSCASAPDRPACTSACCAHTISLTKGAFLALASRVSRNKVWRSPIVPACPGVMCVMAVAVMRTGGATAPAHETQARNGNTVKAATVIHQISPAFVSVVCMPCSWYSASACSSPAGALAPAEAALTNAAWRLVRTAFGLHVVWSAWRLVHMTVCLHAVWPHA